MRKIDLHIARAFLVPFVITTASAVGLYIVVEALGDLEDFLAASDSLAQLVSRMGRAYLARAPVFLTPLAPLTILISGAFAVAQMARNNEITALNASGVSIHRILAPIFVCATLASLVTFANQELVVPFVEVRLLPQLKQWKGGAEHWESLMRVRVESEESDFVLRYNVVKREMLNPLIVQGRGTACTNVSAASGRWSPEGGWLLADVTIGRPGGKVERAQRLLWRTKLTPQALATAVLPASSRPLHRILHQMREDESAVRSRVMFYNRLCYPLVGVALLLTGVPFMLRHESVKRSRLFGAGLCLLLGAGFYAVTLVATSLGEDGALPAAVAGFLPALLFAAVGVYLTDRIRT